LEDIVKAEILTGGVDETGVNAFLLVVVGEGEVVNDAKFL
jgi:hypothetical protein